MRPAPQHGEAELERAEALPNTGFSLILVIKDFGVHTIAFDVTPR